MANSIDRVWLDEAVHWVDWSHAKAAPKVSGWIEGEGKHRVMVNGAKLETIYVHYRMGGNWAVIGTIGSRDISLGTFASEREAAEAIDQIVRSID